MTVDQVRHPAGTPAGGRWAPGSKLPAPDGVTLRDTPDGPHITWDDRIGAIDDEIDTTTAERESAAADYAINQGQLNVLHISSGPTRQRERDTLTDAADAADRVYDAADTVAGHIRRLYTQAGIPDHVADDMTRWRVTRANADRVNATSPGGKVRAAAYTHAPVPGVIVGGTEWVEHQDRMARAVDTAATDEGFTTATANFHAAKDNLAAATSTWDAAAAESAQIMSTSDELRRGAYEASKRVEELDRRSDRLARARDVYAAAADAGCHPEGRFVPVSKLGRFDIQQGPDGQFNTWVKFDNPQEGKPQFERVTGLTPDGRGGVIAVTQSGRRAVSTSRYHSYRVDRSDTDVWVDPTVPGSHPVDGLILHDDIDSGG